MGGCGLYTATGLANVTTANLGHGSRLVVGDVAGLVDTSAVYRPLLGFVCVFGPGHFGCVTHPQNIGVPASYMGDCGEWLRLEIRKNSPLSSPTPHHRTAGPTPGTRRYFSISSPDKAENSRARSPVDVTCHVGHGVLI